MSKQSVQVLYAKYNSTRRPEFRVTTEICQDEDGLFVRKRAGEEAARRHLEDIHGNGLKLRDYYRNIRVIASEPCEAGLHFPYIKGQTLAEQVDAHCADRADFIAFVNEKLDAVLSVQDKYVQPFETSEGFEALFGPVNLGPVPALNPANLDSLFTNFVENEAGTWCIDCEWVLPFPVPVAFVKYRVLLYLFVTQVHARLKDVPLREMLSWFGFSEEELNTYWQMDDRFQQSVHGEGRKYNYTERYRKKSVRVDELERDLQNTITEYNSIIHDKDVHIGNLDDIIRDREVHIASLAASIHDKDVHIGNQANIITGLQAQVRDLMAQNQQLTVDFQTINMAFFWRITKPARVVLDAIKRFIKRNETVYLFLRMCKDTLRHGSKYARESRIAYLNAKKNNLSASLWPSKAELAQQKRKRFPKKITFSVLVPLYNTPDAFLREMIQSVQAQTYPEWELCLADGSDAEHAEVGKTCLELAKKDKRIRYRKLEKNLGISDNTNACIDMATGDYIALFDHDDILHPSALYENMKVICSEDADFIYTDETTFSTTPTESYGHHFKPDFAPDTLRSYNYICHLTVFKRSLLNEIGGGFRHDFDGSQDYDMVLRLSEKARHIAHIPKILYFWRAHAASVASGVAAKPYTVNAGKAALAEHLDRVGLKGTVMDSKYPSTYKVQYEIEGTPLVSIVIPNMDHIDDLKKCVDSIIALSTWKNWEIVIVENNSKNEDTFAYYRSIEEDPRIRIVTWEGGFNFSAICNLGARHAKGDYILLLNNDIEVITPDWLEQMLMFAQRSDVGAVGAMLYYPDDTIQHAGIILGIGGVAGHSHKCYARGEYGYFCRLTLAQDLSAVTGACCMVPRRVWEKIDGLDEGFAVAFNDVDLCLRIRQAGYLIVWTPYAELYHYESKSRGYEDTPEKVHRFEGETARVFEKWEKVLAAGDPYYNPNLTLTKEDFSFR